MAVVQDNETNGSDDGFVERNGIHVLNSAKIERIVNSWHGDGDQ